MKEYIPFETIREDYNEYQLENGILLKMKQMLAAISTDIKPGTNGRKSFGVDFRDVSVVLTQKEFDTSGFEIAYPDEVNERNETREISFTIIKEVINIYETKNSLVIIAPHVTRIALTNKKDKTNSPILRYSSNTMVSTVQKPNFSDIPKK